MMKSIILPLLFTLFAFAKANSQNTLTLELNDIESTNGTLYFSLYNSANGFPNNADNIFKLRKLEKFNKTATVTFTDLPDGSYAAVFFQDENDNAEVDKNFLGIPKEKVGASNMNGLGVPNFKKCKFEVNSDRTLQIEFMN